jgi:hypothetical protein
MSNLGNRLPPGDTCAVNGNLGGGISFEQTPEKGLGKRVIQIRKEGRTANTKSARTGRKHHTIQHFDNSKTRKRQRNRFPSRFEESSPPIGWQRSCIRAFSGAALFGKSQHAFATFTK